VGSASGDHARSLGAFHDPGSGRGQDARKAPLRLTTRAFPGGAFGAACNGAAGGASDPGPRPPGRGRRPSRRHPS
jgi:hypothetical protein